MTKLTKLANIKFEDDVAPAQADIPQYQQEQAQKLAALKQARDGKPYTWEPIHDKLAGLSRNRQKAIRKEAKTFRKHEIKRLKRQVQKQ